MLVHSQKLRSKFPKLESITPYEIELHAGDVLYIPPFFWHHVESLTNCISVLIPFDMSPEEPIHPCCFY